MENNIDKLNRELNTKLTNAIKSEFPSLLPYDPLLNKIMNIIRIVKDDYILIGMEVSKAEYEVILSQSKINMDVINALNTIKQFLK